MENVWQLDPAASYVLNQDPVVRDLMRQLGVPNLFARAVEFDQLHSFVAFENHPSHWIVLHLWQGAMEPERNGLLFEAVPKRSIARAELLEQLQLKVKAMGAKEPMVFSQLPPRQA